jgi:hypothetical protein
MLSPVLANPSMNNIKKQIMCVIASGIKLLIIEPKNSEIAKIELHITFIAVTEENGIFTLFAPYAKLATNASIDKAVTIIIDSKAVKSTPFKKISSFHINSNKVPAKSTGYDKIFLFFKADITQYFIFYLLRPVHTKNLTVKLPSIWLKKQLLNFQILYMLHIIFFKIKLKFHLKIHVNKL